MNQAQGSQPKRSNSGLIIVIIVVFVLAILAVGGYFGWKYVAAKYLKSSANTSPTVAVSPSPLAIPSTSLGTSPTPTAAASLSTSKTISSDYVIADSDIRLITEAELVNLTPWELKVARNEIYARHGRPFVHKDLQCYFATKGWYQKDDNFSESVLSATENKNVATIQAYEQKINSPLQSSDSGC